MSAGSPDDVDMIGFQKPPHLPEDGESKEPKYGSEGLSRFELELEVYTQSSLVTLTYILYSTIQKLPTQLPD